jgi:hypothetical protein
VTAGEVRLRYARLAIVAAAIAAGGAILWMARGFTFYFDEWSFILTAPDWTAITYLQPHDEHPSILFRLVYALLLDTVGLRSYLPYMAVLLSLHAANAVLLFELVRHRTGDLVGVAAASLLLVLGAGWEDILWAFQLAWLASVALGLGMLLCLQAARSSGRLALAMALLSASLMFSGIGLVFLAAAAVLFGASPGRRRDLVWLAPVVIALFAWYVAFGRFGTPPNPPPSAANLPLVPLYAVWGLGASSAALAGLGGVLGLPLLVVALLAVGWSWWGRQLDPFALGVAASLITLYVVTGLTRAQLGYQQSAAGRYVYVGAVLWLILLADGACRLPWRGTWRPALVACLFLACFNSGVLLVSYAAAKTAQMERAVADLQALSAERSDPCLDPHGAADLLVMPQVTSPALYYRAVDRFGDPTAGTTVTDQADFAAARRSLRKPGC